MKIWIPASAIAVAMAALVSVSVAQMAIPELQVHQVLAGERPGVPIKLHGRIKAIHSEFDPLQFEICDKEDASLVVMAQIDATRPDLFKVDNDVAVEGVFDPKTGKIVGDKIYTKCPSKYVASEEMGQGYSDGPGSPAGGEASSPPSGGAAPDRTQEPAPSGS
ncbi:MAG: cytochrome c maturation protein CcmE [Planctomycetota bacterium]